MFVLAALAVAVESALASVFVLAVAALVDLKIQLRIYLAVCLSVAFPCKSLTEKL